MVDILNNHLNSISSGYTLSFETISTLAVRYGGKDRTLFFEDFVLCLSKTVTMFGMYYGYVLRHKFLFTSCQNDHC